ncbi:MAG: hypothetical protein HOY79_28810 [Streptomyces sp.]|nr:hypothetical protein [Streptomyces sp.]
MTKKRSQGFSTPKLDITQVLEHYGASYVPEGRERSMRCPFHGEDRTPSGTVNTETGLFFCFTCGIGGDGWALIQAREGLSFREAREFAAGVFGAGDGDIQQGPSRVTRRRVFDDEAGTERGQQDIFSSGLRRRPFAGS